MKRRPSFFNQIVLGSGRRNLAGITRVVHCSKCQYDVLIDRTTKWGNSHRIGPDGTREEVIQKYREWVVTQPHLMSSLHELRGKRLGCWCSPLPCHGNVLVDLVKDHFGEDS
jgi:hypothetical protein